MSPLIAFSLSEDSSPGRSRLREIIRCQIAYQATREVREKLLVARATRSSLLWADAAWPSLLSRALVQLALFAWILLLVAVLAALALEKRWQRRERCALNDIRGGSRGGAMRDRR